MKNIIKKYIIPSIIVFIMVGFTQIANAYIYNPTGSGGGGGSGTVTAVSVATQNGLAGTSDGNTATPTLTLSTTITGVLKGNGTSISSAVANTDYQSPITLTTTGTSGAATFSANTLNIPQYTGGSGTVTSIATDATLTGGPITTTGTLGINLAHANTWTGSQTVSAAPFAISGNQSQTAWTVAGPQLSTVAATLTDSTSSGTVATHVASSFGIPTFAASSATTYTNAATLYIAGAPVAGTNVTDSFPYALYVNAGNVFFPSTVNGGTFIGSFETASSGPNFFTGNGSAALNNQTVSAFLFSGASTVTMRSWFYGSTSTSIASNISYAGTVFASAPITTPATGTNAMLASIVVNPLGTVTQGAASVTNTASLYVNGAATATVTGQNYSLWDVGQSRFDLGSDATGDIFYRASTGAFTRLGIGATGTHLVVSAGIPSWTAQTGVSNYTHTIFTPTTGQTISLTNNQYNIVNPAGALLALTVNLPSSPANNDVVYIKFTQNVTTVTYANGTVVDGITAPTAGGLTVLTYDSGTTSWY